jgi:Cu(I)/Ag(I) efflux system membrane fusion protein
MVYLYRPEVFSAQEELIQTAHSLDRLGKSTSALVKRSSERSVKAAREKLRLLGLTQAQIRRIEESRQADEHVTIYAPMGGVVIQKHVNEGMYVETGTKIYTIADLTHLWIYLDAYESDLLWIRYGQAVVFQAEAFPGQEFQGIISFVQPFLDEQTRTVRVRVNVENQDLKLKPGLFVTALINARISVAGEVIGPSYAGQYMCPMHPEVVRQKKGSCPICGMTLVRAETLPFVHSVAEHAAQPPLVIPASAPLITGTRAIVYVQQPDISQYEGRQVVLGPRAGAYYIVKEGLQEGESVVTNGSFKIDADLQIRGKSSMMSPHGGKPTGGHAH